MSVRTARTAPQISVSLNGRTVPLTGDPEEAVFSWVFPSSSNPDVEYDLLLKRSGEVFCYCPRWVFKRPNEPRSCKHYVSIAREIEEIRTLFQTGAPLPVYAAPAPSIKAQKKAVFQTADLVVGVTLRTRRMIQIF